MRTALTLASLCLSSLVVPASAQTDVVLPRIFGTTEGNDVGMYPFGRSGFRTQILIDSASLTTTAGVVMGLSFRADNDSSSGSAAVTVTNVTISLSHTTLSHTSMVQSFGANITGTPVIAFAGSLNLPAYTPTSGGVAPWTLIPLTPFPLLPAQGNLLIDITAANAGSIMIPYSIDQALPGGTARSYGTGGDLTPPDTVKIIVAGNGSMGRFSGIVPGGALTYLVESQWRAHAGVFMLGLNGLATPIDLTAYGMPGSSLYIDPLVMLPYTMTSSGRSYRATFPLSIPADPALVGGDLHTQALVLDAMAPGGLAATAASMVRIGETVHPLQQLNSAEHTSAVGSFAYANGILGGAVIRLTGAFQ